MASSFAIHNEVRPSVGIEWWERSYIRHKERQGGMKQLCEDVGTKPNRGIS